MIYKHEIGRLSEEEKGTLIYILNELTPSHVKVDLDTVTAYKKEALAVKLKKAKEKVSVSHGEALLVNIWNKLGIK